MGYIKTQEEMQYILDGGVKMGAILEELARMVAPGVSMYDIDQRAEELIVAAGGRPAFKGYRGSRRDPKFPSTICASVNDEIVHGIPHKKKMLREGDICSIDIGMQWPMDCGAGQRGNGFFTDTALTVPVGKIGDKEQQLIDVTRKSLEIGIESMRIGGRITDIGAAIERYVAPQGYGIVRDLVGHGVGHEVHEEPRVPNYSDPSLGEWPLQPGVVIAIEPMITMKGHAIDMDEEDGWTIRSKNGAWSAHFEHTIVVTEEGPVVATRRPSENRDV